MDMKQKIEEINGRCLEIIRELIDLQIFPTVPIVLSTLLSRYCVGSFNQLQAGPIQTIPCLLLLNEINSKLDLFLNLYFASHAIVTVASLEQEVLHYFQCFNILPIPAAHRCNTAIAAQKPTDPREISLEDSEDVEESEKRDNYASMRTFFDYGVGSIVHHPVVVMNYPSCVEYAGNGTTINEISLHLVDYLETQYHQGENFVKCSDGEKFIIYLQSLYGNTSLQSLGVLVKKDIGREVLAVKHIVNRRMRDHELVLRAELHQASKSRCYKQGKCVEEEDTPVVEKKVELASLRELFGYIDCSVDDLPTDREALMDELVIKMGRKILDSDSTVGRKRKSNTTHPLDSPNKTLRLVSEVVSDFISMAKQVPDERAIDEEGQICVKEVESDARIDNSNKEEQGNFEYKLYSNIPKLLKDSLSRDDCLVEIIVGNQLANILPTFYVSSEKSEKILCISSDSSSQQCRSSLRSLELGGSIPVAATDGMNQNSALSLKQVGRWGERLVYQYLLNSHPPNTKIEWVDRDKDTRSPYDFIIEQPSVLGREKTIYVEVKTTRFPDLNVFEMSWWEWEFATKQPVPNYHIYRVFGSCSSVNDIGKGLNTEASEVSLQKAVKLVIIKDLVKAIKEKKIKLCIAI